MTNKVRDNIYVRFLFLCVLILLVNLGVVYGLGLNVRIELENVQMVKMMVFFLLSSALMLIAHVYIDKDKKEILGYVFLATLTIKMIVSYVFLSLVKGAEILKELEKICFFVLFIEFLFVDVFFTVKLLNKND
jgi:hypothetical protein